MTIARWLDDGGAVRGSGEVGWQWRCTIVLACCYALPFKLLGHYLGALPIMLPAFPMVLTVMLHVYSFLSGHFAMVSGCAAAVVPRCCCHAALPLCMLLTVAHVAYHCSATLPLLYSLVGNTDYQFYPLCHSRSTFHCLTTLPFSS